MSKSSYEEAIALINLNILPRESGKTAKTKVIHALQQAQKQDKLLVLYKQAYDKAIAEVLKMFTMNQDEKTTLNNIIGHLDDNKTVAKIRELENDK